MTDQISIFDGDKPLSRNQLQRMGETKLRDIYNNAKASNNLLSICDISAKDLEIVDTDKFTYLLTYLLIPLPGLIFGMERRRHEKRKRHKIGNAVGGRKTAARGRSSANPFDGECSGSDRQ